MIYKHSSAPEQPAIIDHRVARRDRDHWKHKAKRYEKKINNIKEFLK